MYDVTVIGAAIADVLAVPAGPQVFETGSQPVEQIRLSFGGDALNEAVILSRLGKQVQLVSKVGRDEAGKQVLAYMKRNGLDCACVCVEDGLATGINIVLIDESGERHFLTNPQGSLRKLGEADIAPFLDRAAAIVSFASMFVSPLLDIAVMERLFRQVKESGRLLMCDMTKAKNGERLQDLSALLPLIDIIVPNEAEIALLTEKTDPAENVRLLLEEGVKTAVIKCGAKGCVIGDASGTDLIPAVPGIRCVDSTGAGDAFAAGFLAALSEGWDTRACARYACAAASCAIEQVGAAEGVTSVQTVRQRYDFLTDSI